MGFSSWRGTMGLIKPTHRPGSLEETIRLLPEGIGVVPLTVGLSEGDRKDFDNALGAIEEKVAEMARIGVDLIAPAGAPPSWCTVTAASGSCSTSGSRPTAFLSSAQGSPRWTRCGRCRQRGSWG